MMHILATEVDPAVIAAVLGLILTVGIGLVSWTLVKVVQLSTLVATLTADVRSLSIELRDVKRRIAGVEDRERDHA